MLASLVADDDLAERYHSHAEATIARLCEPEFVAHEDAWEGVLKHGSYHEAKQLGVDESVIGGDLFPRLRLLDHWGERIYDSIV
jgi:unsaturated chondroitin disaccharide hydrolase